MMKRCKDHEHEDLLKTPDEAAWCVAQWLERNFSPELTAKLITHLNDYRNACCPAGAYARYLASVAYREALLQVGWFEPVGQSVEPVEGARSLLDTWDFEFGAQWYEGDYDEYNEWPSEDQLISWNEANDYLHEDDDQ